MAGCWLLSPTNKCLHAPITEWAFHQCLSLLQWHTLTCWANCWWSQLQRQSPAFWGCQVIDHAFSSLVLPCNQIHYLPILSDLFHYPSADIEEAWNFLGWTPRRTPCLFHKFGGWKSSIGDDSAKRNGVIVSVFNQRATTKVLKIYVNLAVNNFEWITSVPCIW